jgi:dGTPase
MGRERSAGTPEAGTARRVRNDFQRDRDRIIHAKAFRRPHAQDPGLYSPGRRPLSHPPHAHAGDDADLRTIARALDLNEDLAEAIALGHDLGHTPFGHTGEEALSASSLAHGRVFRHNEHSLRVVDHLEKGGDGLKPNVRG